MPANHPGANFGNCLHFRDVNDELLQGTGIDLTSPEALGQLAVHFSDGIIQGSAGASETLLQLAQSKNIPTLACPDGKVIRRILQ